MCLQDHRLVLSTVSKTIHRQCRHENWPQVTARHPSLKNTSGTTLLTKPLTSCNSTTGKRVENSFGNCREYSFSLKLYFLWLTGLGQSFWPWPLFHTPENLVLRQPMVDKTRQQSAELWQIHFHTNMFKKKTKKNNMKWYLISITLHAGLGIVCSHTAGTNPA